MGTLNLYAIKNGKNYYLTENIHGNYSSSLLEYYFNGKNPMPSFKNNWVIVEGEILSVQRKESQPSIYRWKLIDTTIASEKIPLVLNPNAVECDPYTEELSGEYAMFRSLYKKIYDNQPDIMVEVPFSLNIVFETDNVKEFKGFNFKTKKGNITDKNVDYKLLDKILFPDIMLPSRPCRLTSEQMYEIIRECIRLNINPKFAKITINYDFCFKVQKEIKYATDRMVTVFEMTNNKDQHKGYTPINEMEGENVDDLGNKVDAYCRELIEAINKPLIECPHCHGTGVVDFKEFK